MGRDELARRTDALLTELADLWGARGDVILHLFDVEPEQVKTLNVRLTSYDTATVEVARGAPYRTVNLSVRSP